MKNSQQKTFCSNRKATYDYHILDTIEAGIVLEGCEVKSIREFNVSLEGAYATIEDGEVFLINCHIDEWKTIVVFGKTYDPTRKRKLLLSKKEIEKFAAKAEEQGNTLIPLDLHLTNGRIKVKLAVAKGKKDYDKRQSIKEAEAKKQIKNY